MTDAERLGFLDDEHTCTKGMCDPPVHYDDDTGLCAVCGGCGDPECCQHDSDCFSEHTFVAGMIVRSR